MAGLLAPAPSSGITNGLLANPNTAGLLGIAQGLLAASGASRLPVTMGAALANGLQGGQAMRQQAERNQMLGQQVLGQKLQNQFMQGRLNWIAGLGQHHAQHPGTAIPTYMSGGQIHPYSPEAAQGAEAFKPSVVSQTQQSTPILPTHQEPQPGLLFGMSPGQLFNQGLSGLLYEPKAGAAMLDTAVKADIPLQAALKGAETNASAPMNVDLANMRQAAQSGNKPLFDAWHNKFMFDSQQYHVSTWNGLFEHTGNGDVISMLDPRNGTAYQRGYGEYLLKGAPEVEAAREGARSIGHTLGTPQEGSTPGGVKYREPGIDMYPGLLNALDSVTGGPPGTGNLPGVGARARVPRPTEINGVPTQSGMSSLPRGIVPTSSYPSANQAPHRAAVPGTSTNGVPRGAVETDISPGQERAQEENQKVIGDYFGDITKQAAGARELNGQLDQLGNDSSDWITSAAAPYQRYAQQFLNAATGGTYQGTLPSRQAFNKITLQMLGTGIHQVSSRAAVQEFNVMRSAFPSEANSEGGNQLVYSGLRGMANYKIGRLLAAQQWKDTHNGMLNGFQAAWLKVGDPAALAFQAMPQQWRQKVVNHFMQTKDGRRYLGRMRDNLIGMQHMGVTPHALAEAQ